MWATLVLAASTLTTANRGSLFHTEAPTARFTEPTAICKSPLLVLDQSANGAILFKPGASPQVICLIKNEALKARFKCHGVDNFLYKDARGSARSQTCG